MRPEIRPATAQAEAPDRLPTGLALPADSRIPRQRRRGGETGREEARWQQPYVSRFVRLEDERERTAWFHFCLGHHIEFLYWEATAAACEQVTAAIGHGDTGAVDRWMLRVSHLIRGSGAMLHYCGAFDPEVYDPCLRASMAAERDDFSGDMSQDFLVMMRAKAAMLDALESGTKRYGHQLQRFRAAERYWHVHHGQVVLSLHPGKSLLRERVEELRRQSESFDYRGYVEAVVHSRQALSDYDDYFGLKRDESMTIDDYWTQAVEKLAAVHRSFAMDADTRAQLMRGDAALLALVSESLEDDARS
jgi:hypothetical protein